MMRNTKKSLEEALGLSAYESRVYVATLNYGQASLSNIARAATMARTAVYPPMQALIERGLVSQIKVGKRLQYRALNPKQLPLVLAQQQKKLEAVIEDLSQNIMVEDNNFSAQYFTGVDGLKIASLLFLEESKQGSTWRTFENPMFPLEKIGEEEFEKQIQMRVEKKIATKVIASANQSMPWIQKRMARLLSELVEVVFVSPRDYPIDATVVTNGEMMYMFSAQTTPFTLLLKNQPLAKTFETMHRITWDRYKKEK